jgi:hypothetical protein
LDERALQKFYLVFERGGSLATFAENGEAHFDRVLPPHHPIRGFFYGLRACAGIDDEKLRVANIFALVEDIHRSAATA